MALGILAAVSICLSALPIAAKVPLAGAALARAAWLARRELSRSTFWLEQPRSGTGVVLSRPDRTDVLLDACLIVRGPLASLRAREADGRIFQACWGPDTLSGRDRRLLRLASGLSHVESGPALATMQG